MIFAGRAALERLPENRLQPGEGLAEQLWTRVLLIAHIPPETARLRGLQFRVACLMIPVDALKVKIFKSVIVLDFSGKTRRLITMRLGTALNGTAWAVCTALAMFLSFYGCSTPPAETPNPAPMLPSQPVPAKSAPAHLPTFGDFHDQILAPWSLQWGEDVLERIKANAKHISAQRQKDIAANRLNPVEKTLFAAVGTYLGGPVGAAVAGGAVNYLDSASRSQSENETLQLQEVLALLDTRRNEIRTIKLNQLLSGTRDCGNAVYVVAAQQTARVYHWTGSRFAWEPGNTCP